MSTKILVINPGSTSTKIAVFEDERPLFTRGIMHDAAKVNTFEKIVDQAPFRTAIIEDILKEENFDINTLDCIMCRGGIILHPQLCPGGYEVNDDLYYALGNEDVTMAHASQLGGLLGKQLADKIGIKAYIYDAVTSANILEVAKVTGFVDIEKKSVCHVLNARAMAMKYAEQKGEKYSDLKIIVAHMGGGCTVSAHMDGQIIDTIGDDEFHISAERSGSTQLMPFAELCYSGKYTYEQMKKLIRGKGGMFAHLGTSDGREIEKMADEGNEKAKLIIEAEAYGMAKSIGAIATTFKQKPDAIVLTGGLAYCKPIANKIKEAVEFIAPVEIMAGENELEAMALGGLRIMRGEEKANEYVLPAEFKK